MWYHFYSELRQVLSLLARFRRTSDQEKYFLAELISRWIYPKYKFSEFGKIWWEDVEFFDRYRAFMDLNNWHSIDRKFNLKSLLALTNSVEGDLVEFGVYKGGSGIFMCDFVAQDSSCFENKNVILVDSFRGLSKPKDYDGEYWSENSLSWSREILETSLAEYNPRIVEGWIPEVLDDVSVNKISFCHIDLDLYEPTLHALNFAYEKLSQGGIILFDDYGFISCPGVKKCVDEFFSEKPETPIELSSGQAFILKASSLPV